MDWIIDHENYWNTLLRIFLCAKDFTLLFSSVHLTYNGNSIRNTFVCVMKVAASASYDSVILSDSVRSRAHRCWYVNYYTINKLNKIKHYVNHYKIIIENMSRWPPLCSFVGLLISFSIRSSGLFTLVLLSPFGANCRSPWSHGQIFM